MAPDVGELVTAADIARRLGLSGERVRQLARENRLPPPVGHAGRNTFWLWETIAGWAAANDRLQEPAARPSPQAWRPRRGSRPEFTRIADDVFPFGVNGIVHARVWRAREDDLRPVVILGNLDDNDGRSVTNAIEEAALVVATRVLGADGLRADWYEYWPDRFDDRHEFKSVTFTIASPEPEAAAASRASRRAFLARRLGGRFTEPIWADVPAAALADLLGEPVELYPYGTYTSENVEHRRGGRTPLIVWDPSGLKPDVDAAVSLYELEVDDTTHAAFLVAARRLVADCVKRVRHNKATAQRQPHPLAVELSPFEPAGVTAQVVEELLSYKGLKKMPATADDLVAAQQHLRTWLLDHGDEEDRYRIVPGRLGLAVLSPSDAGIRDDLPSRHRTVTAVRHADVRLTDLLIEQNPALAELDYPLAMPSPLLEPSGPTAEQYLASLSPRAQRKVDESRAHRLRARFYEDTDIAFSFDPLGRLVAKATEGFVVEWPLGVSDTLREGAVAIVADQADSAAAPVFIELTDGSLDLLPGVADRASDPEFTWGYAGGGPHDLATAITQLVFGTSATNDEFAAVYDVVAGYRSPHLRLDVEDLRRKARRGRS